MTIAIAEMQHASLFGYYDTPDCLIVPSCTRTQPAIDEGFLSAEWTVATEQRGYRIEFIPGPPHKISAAQTSRTALSGFAVIGVPVTATPRRVGGPERRAFCIDDRNKILVSRGDVRPHVDRGRCLNGEPLG